jgi:hypothetical protein
MKTNEQDRLVRAVTAFGSWCEMVEAMKGGYTPTLRRTKACDRLARLCEGSGFRTFRIK